MSSDRFNPYFAVYLVFRNKDQILLLQRFKTGFEDGNYSMVSGHVDAGEDFITAAIREGSEEAGVQIAESDLNLAYIQHYSRPDRAYVNAFFNVEKYAGEILNAEPNKCSDLSWFEINNLPENTIPYIKVAISDMLLGKNTGVWGWN